MSPVYKETKRFLIKTQKTELSPGTCIYPNHSSDPVHITIRIDTPDSLTIVSEGDYFQGLSQVIHSQIESQPEDFPDNIFVQKYVYERESINDARIIYHGTKPFEHHRIVWQEFPDNEE